MLQLVASVAKRIQHLVTELCNKAQDITPRDHDSSTDKSEDEEVLEKTPSKPALVKSKSVADTSDEIRRNRSSIGSNEPHSGQHSPTNGAMGGSKAKKFFGDVGSATVTSPKEKKEKRRNHRDEKRINEEK